MRLNIKTEYIEVAEEKENYSRVIKGKKRKETEEEVHFAV